MQVFDLYSHAVLGPVAVKKGFSWPAFFFTGVWALVCRMWVRGIVLMAILSLSYCTAVAGGGMVAMSEGATTEVDITQEELTAFGLVLMFSYPVVLLVVCSVAGVKGNQWRARDLEGKGFKRLKTVQARNSEAALTMMVSEDGV